MTDYTKLVAAVRDTDFGDTCVYLGLKLIMNCYPPLNIWCGE